jgi:Lrp/AsnC family transcriptional regulator, leucine-responsive regulatory protein
MSELDRIDRDILSAIQRDGRVPVAKLAERVGLSETPCARRLRRLENEGFIDGYRAMLSRKALGLGVVAFVSVRFSDHDRSVSERFEREIAGIERVVSCHNVSGTADYLLQVVVRDLDEYGTFSRDVLRTLPGVTSVESMLSLREIKRDNGLPIPS